jgi:hypothetical protein
LRELASRVKTEATRIAVAGFVRLGNAAHATRKTGQEFGRMSLPSEPTGWVGKRKPPGAVCSFLTGDRPARMRNMQMFEASKSRLV